VEKLFIQLELMVSNEYIFFEELTEEIINELRNYDEMDIISLAEFIRN
jgi:hypothetical protein